MQASTSWTAQSSRQRGQASNTNVSGCIHFHPCNDRLWLLSLIVGQIDTPSYKHSQHVACFVYRSDQVGIQSPVWAIWLEQVSPCPAHVQSCCIQRQGYKRVVGIAWRWQLVFRSFNGPLSVWYTLQTWDLWLLSFGVNRAFPPTLPAPRHDATSTFLSAHRWTHGRHSLRKHDAKRTTYSLPTTTSYHGISCPSTHYRGTKGEWQDSTQGRTKGDQCLTDHHNPKDYRCTKHYWGMQSNS